MTRLKDVQLDIGTLKPRFDDERYFGSVFETNADIEVDLHGLTVETGEETVILSLADLEQIVKAIKHLKWRKGIHD